MPDQTSSFIRSYFQANRWIFAALLVAVAVVYWQTIRFDFVTYDDYDLIVQNADFLSHPANVASAFQTHVFTGHRTESAYYRPILLASFIADYQIWKLAPWGYHFMNVVFHLLTAAMVLIIILQLTGERMTALLGALLFCLHPVQTESVAWISGRNDLLLALFVTTAYVFFAAYRHNPRRRLLFGCSVVAFALALFTKESALFYALLYPLHDYCFPRDAGKSGKPGRKFQDYFFIAVVAAVYILVRAKAIGAFVGAEQFASGTTLMERCAAAPGMFAEHILLILVPIRLSVAHPAADLFWLQPGRLAYCYATVFAAVATAWWCARTDRVALFGFLWMMIGFLPLLDIIPVAVPVLEHRLYLPMAGFSLFAVRIGMRLFARLGSERIAVGLIGIAALACGIAAGVRLPVWQNSETLWQDAIEKAPSYSRSYMNLAGYYFEHRQFDRAASLMISYIGLRPDDPMGYSKLRQTYYSAGKYVEAARVTREMISRTPGNIDRYVEAAELYLQANLSDSALAVYAEGLVVNPNSYQLHDLAGRASVLLRNDREAEQHYRKAIELNPQYDVAWFDLGVLCASQGDYPNAIARIEEGMKYGVPSPEIVQFLNQLYLETKQNDKAENLRKRFPQ